MPRKVNMYLCICVIVLSATFVCAERGTPCETPFGERATCISVLSCPGLLNILITKNQTAIKFATQFQCGYDTEPLVCCRFQDYPPGTFDVFTKTPDTTPSYLDAGIENIFPYDDFLEVVLPEVKECGKDSESNRILADGTADAKEFPWLVALQYKNKLTGEDAGIRCGGSIINKKFILTAAQCILDREFYPTDVWLGDWKLSTVPDCQELVANYECIEKVQRVQVAEFIPHPFYSTTSGNNDIGLLRLANDIKYTDCIQPVCLPPPRIPVPTAQTPLTTTGWETRIHATSNVKLKQTVQMLSNYVCEKSYQNRVIGPNQICAAGKLQKVSYQGDPGGLLMRTYTDKDDRQQRWYQEGVSSWDARCDRPGEPFVYTRISRYIRWIVNIIRRDEMKTDSNQITK